MDRRIYRAIDANINRALEGLRVCEDLERFVFNSGRSAILKELRHEISLFSKAIPERFLLSSRDVGGDSQKFVDTEGEKRRNSLPDLLSSNMGRAAEAVRALEEFSKMLGGDHHAGLQAARFKIYDLWKDMVLGAAKAGNLNSFTGSVYAIIDSAHVKKEDYLLTAGRFADCGAKVIQLRMKGAQEGEIFRAASMLAPYCKERDILFIVNDHPHIAYLSGAGGVHLGQDDLPVSEARKLLSEDIIIGLSTHSYEQAVLGAKENPDYIAVGPVFDTVSKNGALMEGIGTGVLSKICSEVKIPIVAIGGINSGNVKEVRDAGCTCYALISFLFRNGEIEKNMADFMSAASLR